MSRGGWRRRGRLTVLVVLLLTMGLATMIVGGCGGDDPAAETTTTAASSSPTETAQPGAEGEGALLAKEILAAFDEMVGEVAVLANAKPEPAALKPQLEEVYESYMPKMTELNGKYLALREADIAAFGECNSYLGSNRGKHVTDKDNTLTEALKYYNLELGDQEIVGLLSSKPVELLEIAVKQ